MWIRYITVLCVGMLVVTGCASKKNLPTTKGKESVHNVDGYTINNLDFHSFSGRAKTKVKFGNQDQDVTLNIRIERDKAIWISVTATVFNYEAARVMITPDSIRIMNKMQSELIAKPFSYVYRYTGEGVNFSTLQDLLLANVSKDLLKTDQITVASAINEVQLVGIKNDLSFQYSLNPENRPRVFRLNKVGSQENLEAYYSSFNKVSGYNFPQNQNIKLKTNEIGVDAVLNYNKVEFNQSVEMPFTVPVKYKVIN